MKKLIQLEWLKFSNHRGLRIGIILYAILFFGGYFAFREIAKVSVNPVIDMVTLTQFPLIWDTNGYIGNWLAFFILGYIGIQLISIEFGNKTFRQNVISGLDRKDFLLSKLLSALLISIGATLFYVILTVALGLIITEDSTVGLFAEGAGLKMLYFFLMNFGYVIAGMFIAFLVRKGSLAIFIYFLYGMFVENILRWSVHSKVVPDGVGMHYYPLNVLEDLTPMPYFAQMMKMGSPDMELILQPQWAALATAVYLTIFTLVMFRLATKKDI